ncbi:uncharacterized protein LOC143642845 isoform X2 [Tamandua tetradactyla]|uniref:uncharacterized protein LOC143642845 isoform X2 n=1 Tax=Tamandua tetradactyla TaxID=48850 RepID=UPI0040542DC8
MGGLAGPRSGPTGPLGPPRRSRSLSAAALEGVEYYYFKNRKRLSVTRVQYFLVKFLLMLPNFHLPLLTKLQRFGVLNFFLLFMN